MACVGQAVLGLRSGQLLAPGVINARDVPAGLTGRFRSSSNGGAVSSPVTLVPDTVPDTTPDAVPAVVPDTVSDTTPDTTPDAVPAAVPAAVSDTLEGGDFKQVEWVLLLTRGTHTWLLGHGAQCHAEPRLPLRLQCGR